MFIQNWVGRGYRVAGRESLFQGFVEGCVSRLSAVFQILLRELSHIPSMAENSLWMHL
jgi:hypothetical protein